MEMGWVEGDWLRTEIMTWLTYHAIVIHEKKLVTPKLGPIIIYDYQGVMVSSNYVKKADKYVDYSNV